MGRTFRTGRAVAFGEVDWARVLYYPRFLHHCHMAFEEFMEEALGLPYAELLEDRALGFPTVRVEADYRKPVPYGLTLDIEIAVITVGTRSLTLRYRGFGAGEDEERFAATMTTVLVDMKSFESRPIPDWIREGLAPWLEATDLA